MGKLALTKVKDLELGKFTLTATRLMVKSKPTFDDWVALGAWLQRADGAVAWWLGDWALFGEGNFEDRASQILDATHWDEKRLANVRWVCSAVGASRRRRDLSFEHHASVSRMDPDDQTKWLAKAHKHGWNIHEFRRAIRIARRGRKFREQGLPAGKFRVLYADPPWKYQDEGVVNDTAYTRAEKHYPTMEADEIAALPILDMVADDAALLLWVPVPLLEDAFPVLHAWGFEYRSNFVWDKVMHQPGNYNSVRHEHLLIGVRGSATQEGDELFDSVQTIERSNRHSEKPEDFRVMIDKMYPPMKGIADRIELFARSDAPKGWKAWGNEMMVEPTPEPSPGTQTVEDALPPPNAEGEADTDAEAQQRAKGSRRRRAS
jgi:N6-adenosine-specific RNA methylase IME4